MYGPVVPESQSATPQPARPSRSRPGTRLGTSGRGQPLVVLVRDPLVSGPVDAWGVYGRLTRRLGCRSDRCASRSARGEGERAWTRPTARGTLACDAEACQPRDGEQRVPCRQENPTTHPCRASCGTFPAPGFWETLSLRSRFDVLPTGSTATASRFSLPRRAWPFSVFVGTSQVGRRRSAPLRGRRASSSVRARATLLRCLALMEARQSRRCTSTRFAVHWPGAPGGRLTNGTSLGSARLRLVAPPAPRVVSLLQTPTSSSSEVRSTTRSRIGRSGWGACTTRSSTTTRGTGAVHRCARS